MRLDPGLIQAIRTQHWRAYIVIVGSCQTNNLCKEGSLTQSSSNQASSVKVNCSNENKLKGELFRFSFPYLLWLPHAFWLLFTWSIVFIIISLFFFKKRWSYPSFIVKILLIRVSAVSNSWMEQCQNGLCSVYHYFVIAISNLSNVYHLKANWNTDKLRVSKFL